MKMKILDDYGRIKAGTELEIEAIRFDPSCIGAFAVRVRHTWKKPQWFSIGWFVKIPKGVDWDLRHVAIAGTEKKGKSA